MLAIKLGDKKQYLTLLIINDILLLLIPCYQTQRREVDKLQARKMQDLALRMVVRKQELPG